MTDRKSHLDTLAVSSLLLCCVLWGLNQIAVKLALPQVPPLAQLGIRSLVATVLVVLWARWRGIELFARDGTLGPGLLAGALFAAEFSCVFLGLQYTTASRMVVFLYLSPFVVALGMPFISRSERLSPLQFVGLLIAFGGVASAFAEGFTQPHGPQQWIGDSLGLIAAVLWGFTTLTIRATRLAGVAAEKTLFYQLAVSVVAGLGGALVAGETMHTPWTAQTWGLLAFQGVVITFLSYLLWFWLVRHYPATRVASFVMLTPVSGLVAGAALLGEPVTLRLVLALLAVLAGIALVNRR